MFSKTAFIKGRTPPVPPFPKSATGGEKKEENKDKENEPSPHRVRSPSPVPSGASRSQSPIPRLKDLIMEDSPNPSSENVSARPVGIIAEAAGSRHAQLEARMRQLFELRQSIEKENLNKARISNVAAEEARYAEMVRKSAVQEATDADRESLCIKAGKTVGGDRTQVTIWPMLDIEHSDQAMIIKVKDLVCHFSLSNSSKPDTDCGSLVPVSATMTLCLAVPLLLSMNRA